MLDNTRPINTVSLDLQLIKETSEALPEGATLTDLLERFMVEYTTERLQMADPDNPRHNIEELTVALHPDVITAAERKLASGQSLEGMITGFIKGFAASE